MDYCLMKKYIEASRPQGSFIDKTFKSLLKIWDPSSSTPSYTQISNTSGFDKSISLKIHNFIGEPYMNPLICKTVKKVMLSNTVSGPHLWTFNF